MSGTAFGTVVLHVVPEAAVGGPLAVVRDGDYIVLDVTEGHLDLDVDPDDLARRTPARTVRVAPSRGYRQMYQEHVLQADEGCDFDFLQGPSDEGDVDTMPTGLFSGWFSGW